MEFTAETQIGYTPIAATGESFGDAIRNLVKETEKMVSWKANASIDIMVSYADSIDHLKIKVSNYK